MAEGNSAGPGSTNQSRRSVIEPLRGFYGANPDEALAIWDRLVAPRLGRRALDQFKRATLRGDNEFVERVLRPHLFMSGPAGAGGPSYYPVEIFAETPGRNHYLAFQMANPSRGAFISKCNPQCWAAIEYFANALSVYEPAYELGEWGWIGPSWRVALGPFLIFTFEADNSAEPVQFLERQLSWLRSVKHPTDSRIGKLFVDLSKYADFSGITVCYGGNKSLHIHIVFQTDLLASRLLIDRKDASPPPRFYRNGIMAIWDRLLPLVETALGNPGDFDPKLREPEMYRRMPNGMRLVGSPKGGGRGHCLGAEPGALIPQITLWERWRARAVAGATALFLDPTAFVAAPDSIQQRVAQARGRRSYVGGDCSPEDLTELHPVSLDTHLSEEKPER